MHEMEQTHSGNGENVVKLSDAKILDELTTNRGELKLRSYTSFNEDKRSQASLSQHLCPYLIFPISLLF